MEVPRVWAVLVTASSPVCPKQRRRDARGSIVPDAEKNGKQRGSKAYNVCSNPGYCAEKKCR